MDTITRLQKQPQNIRNICILAHVDHGKTTLSDCLLSSNGIVSSKMAGKVRYLDSRPDEQQRGITMKSSAISLFFTHISSSELDPTKQVRNDYLINLIDSPGHVDFASEVSSASRLCDGALLLVDALEGVCAQTHTVLKQAIQENIKPILVLNKIDRLILELKQTPEEAFVHLSHIIEQVNAILGGYEQQVLLNIESNDGESIFAADYYFSPEKGNVIFASAIDGWAFRTIQFAKLYAQKLGISESKLSNYMWGNFYLDSKQKSIVNQKALKGRNLKPLFVQFILENIWLVYDTVLTSNDIEKLEKITNKLEIKLMARELKSKDKRALLQTVMSQWLPLSHATLLAVVQKVPDPQISQATKISSIIRNDTNDRKVQGIIDSARTCDSSNDAPLVCFLSKVFSVSRSALPVLAITEEEKRQADDTRRLHIARNMAKLNEMNLRDTNMPADPEIGNDSSENEVLIGLCRIYSGVIKLGQSIYTLNPKYIPNSSDPTKYYSEMVVERLFLLMGKELNAIDQVSAGNIFGILSSEANILKTATLTSTLDCPSLACLSVNNPPILQVAITPKDPSKLNELINGLEMLEKADTCAEVFLNEIGEHVLVCAGELHLEVERINLAMRK